MLVFRNMSWLVVGANSQLGKSMCLLLNDLKIDHKALSSRDLDVRSLEQCMNVVNQIKPHFILNCAAWTNVDLAETEVEKTYLVNVNGARNLATAAKAINATFIQISTDYVFSGEFGQPWMVSDPTNPQTVYGASKAAAEIAISEEYPEGSYIFRTAWLYSQWGQNFVKTIRAKANSRTLEIPVVNDQFGQPTSATDLALQIVLSIKSKLPIGTYHATNSGEASWFDFAKEIYRLSGLPSERIIPFSSSDFARPASRPKYSVLDHSCWNAIGAEGTRLNPMRDWKIALREHLLGTPINFDMAY